jgi:hypothetical protein
MWLILGMLAIVNFSRVALASEDTAAPVCATSASAGGVIVDDNRTYTLQLSKPVVTVRHKIDVDDFEDRCINEVIIEMSAYEGCNLSLLFNADGGQELQLIEADFNADSFCPGWPDSLEGEYIWSRGRKEEVLLRVEPLLVPDRTARQSWVELDMSADDFQMSAGRVKLMLEGLSVSGTFLSEGTTEGVCPGTAKPATVAPDLAINSYLGLGVLSSDDDNDWTNPIVPLLDVRVHGSSQKIRPEFWLMASTQMRPNDAEIVYMDAIAFEGNPDPSFSALAWRNYIIKTYTGGRGPIGDTLFWRGGLGLRYESNPGMNDQFKETYKWSLDYTTTVQAGPYVGVGMRLAVGELTWVPSLVISRLMAADTSDGSIDDEEFEDWLDDDNAQNGTSFTNASFAQPLTEFAIDNHLSFGNFGGSFVLGVTRFEHSEFFEHYIKVYDWEVDDPDWEPFVMLTIGLVFGG